MHRNARSSITIPRGPTRGGSIDFALYQEPETLNPQLASQAASEEISVFIVEGLVGAVDDATYYPRLATEVPTVQNGGVSADGKTVIYHLKPGVRWSDGYPVSAEDVRFTWEAIMHPHSGAAIRSGFRDIETVECPDPATVVVRYKIPYAPYLRLFGSIMPKHVSGDPAEMPQWAYNRKPVGTGPFVLSDWTPGDRIMLVRNPWYRDANKPHLDAVTFRLVGDREVGKRLLRSAEVDVLWDLGESDIDELQHEAGIALSIHPAAEVERLVLNLADPAIDGPSTEEAVQRPHPILGDPQVREAIDLGIDRGKLADTLFGGLGRLGTTPLQFSWATGTVPLPPSHPERAIQLLEAAGWVSGPDGIRVAKAAKFASPGARLHLTLLTTTGSPLRQRVAQMLIDQLKHIGIELAAEFIPSATLFGSWAGGGVGKHGRFDILMYAVGPRIDPHSHLEDNFASWSVPSSTSGGVGFNYSRWRNQTADEAIRRGSTSLDHLIREEAYRVAIDQIVADRPHIFLYRRTRVHAHRTRLRGWSPNRWDNLGWNSADWWVDADPLGLR